MARILVVDDEEVVRSMLRLALERDGHTVSEACDGREALRVCRDEGPDVMLLDIFMPECDGIETVRALRGEMPELKIVAMSGGGRYGQVDVLDAATKFGAQCALAKPATVRELLGAVRGLLQEPPAS